MSKQSRVFVTVISLVVLTASVALAKANEAERDRANKAASVLTEIMQAADKGIPDELMQNAKAVAVIPHVVKGAFGLGGRYGKGLVSHRLPNGRWSPPAFMEVGGGTFGLKLGVEATDLVRVFTNASGVNGLLKVR